MHWAHFAKETIGCSKRHDFELFSGECHYAPRCFPEAKNPAHGATATGPGNYVRQIGNFEKPETFLRKSPGLQHWHIQPAGQVADTFQALTKIIRCKPIDFFSQVKIDKRYRKW